jgi:tetratricopeptide (TPR) repeat protein
MQLYTDALTAYPGQADLLYARSLVAVPLGLVTQAEEDLRAVLAQKPDDPQALNALGYTLVDRTERYHEGFELIRRAFERNPDDPAVIDSMGWAHYRLGELNAATGYLEQAYQLDPAAEIGAHLIEVLWMVGRKEEASEILRDALKQHPQNEVLHRTKERLGL